MKKYKEWLTNEIEIMESETSENYPHEQMVEREVVLNLINQLDEPEAKQIKELDSYNDELIRDNNQLRNALDSQKVLSQEWVDENSTNLPMSSPMTRWVPVSKLQNILVPKQELPVIPKFVADWITKHRDTFDLYPALKELEDKPAAWKPGKRIYEWYRMNTHQFVNAYLTGEYEVEEEQKYIIEVSDGLYLSQPLGDTSNNEIVMTWSKEQAYKFKDEESIEGHLLKFKGSMAKPVEEMEE